MSQQFETLLNHRYEVRSPEACTVTDSSGIHLCTAIPGCVAEFYGDGFPVTLSAESALLREIPTLREVQPWKVSTLSAGAGPTTLRSGCIYRAGELASLSLNADAAEDRFFCELCFTSGSVPTSLTVPAAWKWTGEHLSNGVFVPQANFRYRLVVLSDGVFIRAAAEGVAL